MSQLPPLLGGGFIFEYDIPYSSAKATQSRCREKIPRLSSTSRLLFLLGGGITFTYSTSMSVKNSFNAAAEGNLACKLTTDAEPPPGFIRLD